MFPFVRFYRFTFRLKIGEISTGLNGDRATEEEIESERERERASKASKNSFVHRGACRLYDHVLVGLCIESFGPVVNMHTSHVEVGEEFDLGGTRQN